MMTNFRQKLIALLLLLAAVSSSSAQHRSVPAAAIVAALHRSAGDELIKQSYAKAAVRGDVLVTKGKGGRLDISGLVFKGKVEISDYAVRSLRFSHCVFAQPVTVKLLNGSEISFDSCRFVQSHQVATYGSQDTLTTVAYHQCVFASTVRLASFVCQALRFSYCRTETDASFYSTQALKYASFLGTDFRGSVDFSTADFRQEAAFNECSFARSPNFFATQLPQQLSLNNVQAQQEVDLTGVVPSPGQPDTARRRISLYGASIDKIRLNYGQFRLFFDDAQTSRLDLQNNVYLALLAKQKADGFLGSYKALDLEYRNFYATHFEKTKLPYYLNKIWWNFGYDKERIFLHAVWLVLLFSFVTLVRLRHLATQVYTLPTIGERIKQFQQHTSDYRKHPPASRRRWLMRQWLKRFSLSVFYTGIIFFGLKLEVDHLHFTHGGWVFYVLFVYTVGLICTAFMFNFIVSV